VQHVTSAIEYGGGSKDRWLFLRMQKMGCPHRQQNE
jgi:hypothetical protein